MKLSTKIRFLVFRPRWKKNKKNSRFFCHSFNPCHVVFLRFLLFFFLPGFTGFYRVFPSIKQPTAFETAKKIKEGGNKKNNTEHFWISFFFWFLLVSGGSQLGARRLARQLAPRRQSATPQVSYLRSVHRTIKKNTKKGQTEKKRKRKERREKRTLLEGRQSHKWSDEKRSSDEIKMEIQRRETDVKYQEKKRETKWREPIKNLENEVDGKPPFSQPGVVEDEEILLLLFFFEKRTHGKAGNIK